MKYLIFVLAALLFISCQQEKEQDPAQEIIDKAIEEAGGEKYRRAMVEFEFRGHKYISTRDNGEFQLERIIIDSLGTYRDVVSNTGFERFLNDSLLNLPDTMSIRYSGSVNSVHYFAHLPFGLNDPAVNKSLAGEAVIDGEPYYQLKVTFQQEGGGADHHDKFMYWIHKENYTIDYLAYKFQVNEGGIRFREAYNPRRIEGIRFVDYKNYTIDDFNTKLENLDELYQQGKLELLSDIKTENVQVKLID